MTSQLYTAASGLLLEQRRLDLISNNLANVSTDGFRAQRLFGAIYQRFGTGASDAVRAANAAVAAAGSYDVPGSGPVRQTGRALDIALDDGTFLTVETPSGRRYTRVGNLRVSPDGNLTDALGYPVLNETFKPFQGLGASASISGDGRVVEGDNDVGRLKLIRDPDGVLSRQGNGLLTAAGNDDALEAVPEPQVRPGWLEGSGTDALGELVRLIEAQRSFETYQRLVSLTMNDVNRKTVNDIAG